MGIDRRIFLVLTTSDARHDMSYKRTYLVYAHSRTSTAVSVHTCSNQLTLMTLNLMDGAIDLPGIFPRDTGLPAVSRSSSVYLLFP